jgi:glutamate-1-semialdehyde 2,1-aminomutase
VQRHLSAPAFVQSSQGVMLTDLDGNRFYDLTGSYGVNLLGYDFYKGSIARAVERAGELGPVLGSYHPVVADNVARLKAISGLDEVSFHMSGTEAVMQAVRLARYHTRRTHSCASAAPITAGGATCSPASAIRFRRARPIRSTRCRKRRCAC